MNRKLYSVIQKWISLKKKETTPTQSRETKSRETKEKKRNVCMTNLKHNLFGNHNVTNEDWFKKSFQDFKIIEDKIIKKQKTK